MPPPIRRRSTSSIGSATLSGSVSATSLCSIIGPTSVKERSGNTAATWSFPATLQRKIDIWCSNGRIFREDDELFSEESWIQVLLGQGIVPRGYDPLVAIKSDAQIEKFLGNIEATIKRCVDVMPAHGEYISKFCPADAIA